MTKHLRIGYTMFFLLASVLLLQACTVVPTEQPPPEAEPVKLKVVAAPFLTSSPFFIGEAEGYFAEQNIEVEFIRFDNPADALPALIQGDFDVFSGLTTVSMLNAIAQGSAVKVVADKGHVHQPTECASSAFMISHPLTESGELTGPAQLEGKMISLDPVSIEGYFLEQLLSSTDLTLDDFQFEEPPPPVELDGLQKGTIDVARTSEPWVTRIIQAEAGEIWVPINEIAPDFPLAVILYGPNLLEDNPDVGKRFMVAYLKAVRQFNEGATERNLDILEEKLELERELLEEACWPAFNGDGMIGLESLLAFQDWAVQKDYMDAPATEEQIWDPSFAEYAAGVLDSESE